MLTNRHSAVVSDQVDVARLYPAGREIPVAGKFYIILLQWPVVDENLAIDDGANLSGEGDNPF